MARPPSSIRRRKQRGAGGPRRVKSRKKSTNLGIVKKHFKFLSKLARANNSQERGLLQRASPGAINALRYLLKSLLLNKFRLSEAQRRKLDKHRNIVKLIAGSKVPPRKRKDILQQRGGQIFSLLIPALAALLPAILGK